MSSDLVAGAAQEPQLETLEGPAQLGQMRDEQR
jgi:hypothetical protein